MLTSGRSQQDLLPPPGSGWTPGGSFLPRDQACPGPNSIALEGAYGCVHPAMPGHYVTVWSLQLQPLLPEWGWFLQWTVASRQGLCHVSSAAPSSPDQGRRAGHLLGLAHSAGPHPRRQGLWETLGRPGLCRLPHHSATLLVEDVNQMSLQGCGSTRVAAGLSILCGGHCL